MCQKLAVHSEIKYDISKTLTHLLNQQGEKIIYIYITTTKI